MARASRWIRERSKTPVAVAALIIFMVTVIFVLPGQSANASAETGGGDSPDLSFRYTVNDLYRMAEAFGPEGRSAYIRARLTFDVVWPIVYTLFLASMTSWLFSRGFPADSRWQSLNMVPVIGLALDYLENLSTVAVMWRYPLRTPVVDHAATVFTPLKWVFIGGSFILVIVGVLRLIWEKVSSR